MFDIDVEQLDLLIKCDDSFWSWSLFGGKHYVTNKCLAFVIEKAEADDDEDAWELMDCLKLNFKKEPVEGVTLILQHGDISEKTDSHIPGALEKQFDKKSLNCGKVKPLIYAHKDFRYRWASFENFNLFVQDRFISLLYDAVNADIFADGPESPAYLCDGKFMILPLRNRAKEGNGSIDNFEKLIKSLPEDIYS